MDMCCKKLKILIRTVVEEDLEFRGFESCFTVISICGHRGHNTSRGMRKFVG